jgi:hypothetical protein
MHCIPFRRISSWLLLSATLALPAIDAAAQQNYGQLQRLVAPAVGEGQPGGHFGIKVAVDGDLAVVAEKPEAMDRVLLRGYRRTTGNTWVRDPALTIEHADREFVDLALDDGRLAYSTTDPVDGSRAVYIKDALADGWEQENSIFSSDLTYGTSLAVAGDRVAIGVPGTGNQTGFVSVRTRSNDGIWTSAALSPSPHAGARFGASVGIVAGAVVVGAPGEDSTSPVRTDAGAAYVFELTQSTWSQVARFTPAVPENTGHFGHSVAISGTDTAVPEAILVGAPREAGTDGAVYVYKRGTSNWAQTMHIQDPPSPQIFQQFGVAVALDAGYAVIGSNTYDANGVQRSGAIYGLDFNNAFTSAVFTLRSDPLGAESDRLGTAIAIDRAGPTVFVGSPDAELYNNQQQGVVLTSRGTSANPFPALARSIDLGQGLSYSGYGRAIDADAERVVVGSMYESVGNLELIGAAYVYRRNGTTGLYELETRLQSPNAAPFDLFGSAVAVSGDSILVGAIGRDNGGTDTGIVYAFRRVSGLWQLEAQLSSGCASTTRRHFGRRIAFDGTRAQIGGVCPFEGGPGLDLGTRIFVRGGDGTWTSSLVEEISRLGGGDWDNGLAVMGIPVNNGNDSNYGFGVVYSFLPDGGDWSQAGSAGTGATSNQGYGEGVAIDAGTLAVTSAASSHPVYVYRRSGNTFLPEASLIAPDLGADDPTRAVAVAGNRIVFGAHRHTVSMNLQGAAYVFQKQGGVWVQRQKILPSTQQAGAAFGEALAMSPDGVLFVGAPYQSLMFDGQGTVYVYRPPADVLLQNGFE